MLFRRDEVSNLIDTAVILVKAIVKLIVIERFRQANDFQNCGKCYFAPTLLRFIAVLGQGMMVGRARYPYLMFHNSSSSSGTVNISTPSCVMRMVCSNCADIPPSDVATVH